MGDTHSGNEMDEDENSGDDGLGEWDDDEEISAGDASDASASDDESLEDERPTKKVKFRGK